MAKHGAWMLLGRNAWCLQMDTVRPDVAGVAGHPQRLSRESSGSRKYDTCEPYSLRKRMTQFILIYQQSFEYAYRRKPILMTLPLLQFGMCVCVRVCVCLETSYPTDKRIACDAFKCDRVTGKF